MISVSNSSLLSLFCVDDVCFYSYRMFQQVDVSGDQKIDYEEFVAMLKLMDRRLKSLPATAQVASQQVGPLLVY